jgi:integrase
MAKHLIKSDRSIHAMKPGAKRLNDGAGLHIRQRRNSKHWYQDYTINRQRSSLSIGPYPEVGLSEARRRSLEIRTDVAHGIDPSAKRKAAKSAERERRAAVQLLGRQDAKVGTFEHVAREWLEVRRRGWSDPYVASEIARLKKHIFPALGQRPIAGIRREEFTQIFAAIDSAGKVSTTGRLYGHCRRICDFAVAKGYLQTNVCRELDEALQTGVTKHHAAMTTPENLAEFLRDVETYRGDFVVVSALEVLMRTLLRSNELRWAKWSEIQLDKGTWLVPAERMKASLQDKLNQPPHLVHLSDQVRKILQQLQRITGRGKFVFAGQGWKHPVISENTINKAIRAMGYCTSQEQTAHGFRATARTILVERCGWHEAIVELQLDHAVLDANGRAYNRTQLEAERREMLQAWSDYLDAIKEGKQPADVPHHGQAISMSLRPPPRALQSVQYAFRFAGIRGIDQFQNLAIPLFPTRSGAVKAEAHQSFTPVAAFNPSRSFK